MKFNLPRKRIAFICSLLLSNIILAQVDTAYITIKSKNGRIINVMDIDREFEEMQRQKKNKKQKEILQIPIEPYISTAFLGFNFGESLNVEEISDKLDIDTKFITLSNPSENENQIDLLFSKVRYYDHKWDHIIFNMNDTLFNKIIFIKRLTSKDNPEKLNDYFIPRLCRQYEKFKKEDIIDNLNRKLVFYDDKTTLTYEYKYNSIIDRQIILTYDSTKNNQIIKRH